MPSKQFVSVAGALLAAFLMAHSTASASQNNKNNPTNREIIIKEVYFTSDSMVIVGENFDKCGRSGQCSTTWTSSKKYSKEGWKNYWNTCCETPPGQADLVVRLGSDPAPLLILEITPTEIVTELPDVPDGDYLLVVYGGNSTRCYDSYDLTIGGTGEKGDPGLSCWDLNANYECDPNEDIDGIGGCNALDCQGVSSCDCEEVIQLVCNLYVAMGVPPPPLCGVPD